MKPDGVNGTSAAQQPKQSLTDRVKQVNVSNTEQLSQELAGLTNSTKETTESAIEDRHITINEFQSIADIEDAILLLKKNVTEALKTAGNDIKTTYENALTKLTNLYNQVRDSYTKAGISIDYETSLEIRERNRKLAQDIEPEEYDSQKLKQQTIMSEETWLASVSKIVKETYLRIVNPEKYQGHGGAGDVARKSYNAKIGGLEGLIRTYSNELNENQVQFIEREIQRYNELAKLESANTLSSSPSAKKSPVNYGSNFYDNPANGQQLQHDLSQVVHNEGLTLSNTMEVVNPTYNKRK